MPLHKVGDLNSGTGVHHLVTINTSPVRRRETTVSVRAPRKGFDATSTCAIDAVEVMSIVPKRTNPCHILRLISSCPSKKRTHQSRNRSLARPFSGPQMPKETQWRQMAAVQRVTDPFSTAKADVVHHRSRGDASLQLLQVGTLVKTGVRETAIILANWPAEHG